MSDPLDIGSGCTLRYVSWGPDRALNPQYAGDPDIPRWGAILTHPLPDGTPCEGYLQFDGPVQRRVSPERPMWQVTSWEPLTLTPSVLCSCGFHGWVTDGRLVST